MGIYKAGLPIESTTDSHTKLLVHSDTNGGAAFVDSSASGHIVSGSGNVQHKGPKIGKTSMIFGFILCNLIYPLKFSIELRLVYSYPRISRKSASSPFLYKNS